MSKQTKEIRGMDTRELRVKLNDLRKEQFNLRFRRTSAEDASKTSRNKQVRTAIARILTVIGERDRAEKAGKATGGRK